MVKSKSIKQRFTDAERWMLETVEKGLRGKGWIIYTTLWTKAECSARDGGHITYKTGMCRPSDTKVNESWIVDVTVRDGEVSLVSCYKKVEAFLTWEL